MRPKPLVPEINVTPLVDVVLVLLIIFMVVIPQLDAGVAVSIPTAANPDAETEAAHEPLTVTVTEHGELYFNRQPIAESDLLAALADAHERAPERPLQIKGDHGARYGRIRRLFATGQALGFPGVGLEVGDPADDAAEGES